MQQFQSWDQVLCINGPLEGKAGVVQGFDKETGETRVKFDDLETLSVIQSDDLKRLG